MSGAQAGTPSIQHRFVLSKQGGLGLSSHALRLLMEAGQWHPLRADRYRRGARTKVRVASTPGLPRGKAWTPKATA